MLEQGGIPMFNSCFTGGIGCDKYVKTHWVGVLGLGLSSFTFTCHFFCYRKLYTWATLRVMYMPTILYPTTLDPTIQLSNTPCPPILCYTIRFTFLRYQIETSKNYYIIQYPPILYVICHLLYTLVIMISWFFSFCPQARGASLFSSFPPSNDPPAIYCIYPYVNA